MEAESSPGSLKAHRALGILRASSYLQVVMHKLWLGHSEPEYSCACQRHMLIGELWSPRDRSPGKSNYSTLLREQLRPLGPRLAAERPGLVRGDDPPPASADGLVN